MVVPVDEESLIGSSRQVELNSNNECPQCSLLKTPQINSVLSLPMVPVLSSLISLNFLDDIKYLAGCCDEIVEQYRHAHLDMHI